MEEKRYTIEKIERDISEQKKAKVTHTINCASHAAVTAYVSTLSVLSQNPTSNVIGLSIGGIIATIAILEMINVNKRQKMIDDLTEIKNQLIKEKEEEVKNRSR